MSDDDYITFIDEHGNLFSHLKVTAPDLADHGRRLINEHGDVLVRIANVADEEYVLSFKIKQ